jgi:hypothetical protein
VTPGAWVMHASRLRSALLLGGAVAFVAIGALLVRAGHPFVGGASVVFFGAGIPKLLRLLLDTRPRLVIDEQGVLDRALGVGLIPWSEITGASVRALSGQRFVCLEVRDPRFFTAQLGSLRRALLRANRALGFPELSLSVSDLPVGADEVVAEIQRQCTGRRDR